MIQKSTHYAKQGEVQRNWVLVDAEGAVLGRLATQVAMILRGKNKPQFTPNSDCGDFVVVINADKVQLTGNKANQKVYYRHSGYNGGLKAETFVEAMEKHPEQVIERAVRGMLPKTTLGRQQLKKLKVYAGAEHPHAAQNPTKIDLRTPLFITAPAVVRTPLPASVSFPVPVRSPSTSAMPRSTLAASSWSRTLSLPSRSPIPSVPSMSSPFLMAAASPASPAPFVWASLALF